jgi:hypothetical protein
MLLYTQGDPLNGERSKELAELYTALRTWLNAVYGGASRSVGRKFTIGTQDDGSSCGVCVMNAMDHAMFGQALFTQADRHLVRMGLFAKLAGHLVDMVGALLTLSAP